MKLLYLSSWFPYPPDNGSRKRAYALLQHLAQGNEISLIALHDSDQEPLQIGALEPFCKSIVALPRREFQPTHLRALVGFFSTVPRSVVSTFDPALQTAIDRALQHESFDAILVGELSIARYVRTRAHRRIILDAAEASIPFDAYSNSSGRARWRNGLTWFKYARYMRALAARFVAFTIVSPREKMLLGRMGIPLSKLFVVPNGVECCDLEKYAEAGDPFSLIYNGALTYAANLDAMRYFSNEILPRIRAVEPRAHLRITGRADKVVINEFSVHNAVSFTGYLPDVRPLLRSSAVCVVPLRVGGGTRLKLLEAMALGTPVVATSKGAEGLNLRDGEHLLIADTPELFADATVRLLHDASLRKRLTSAAQRHVCAQYNWTHISQRLDRLLHDAINSEDEC